MLRATGHARMVSLTRKGRAEIFRTTMYTYCDYQVMPDQCAQVASSSRRGCQSNKMRICAWLEIRTGRLALVIALTRALRARRARSVRKHLVR